MDVGKIIIAIIKVMLLSGVLVLSIFGIIFSLKTMVNSIIHKVRLWKQKSGR